MQKENPVNTQSGHARNHRTVNRVRVVVPHQVELVPAALAQLVITFFIRARHGQPVLFTGHMADTVHGHGQNAVIARRKVVRPARSGGFDGQQSACRAGRDHHVSDRGHGVNLAVNPFGLDYRSRRHGDGLF
ncbi:Uncharacterised protein [Enterobacter cloacae]|nr:Uncharacterised protein [Enterobacter cloacae]